MTAGRASQASRQQHEALTEVKWRAQGNGEGVKVSQCDLVMNGLGVHVRCMAFSLAYRSTICAPLPCANPTWGGLYEQCTALRASPYVVKPSNVRVCGRHCVGMQGLHYL